MLIEILCYFCILFTFTLLIYWPFLNYYKQTPFINRTIPYVTGLKFGVAGLILIFSGIHLSHGIIAHTPFIMILYSGLLGGPYAVLISGFIIGLGLFFLPDLSLVPILFNVNFVVLVVILFFISKKYAITHKSIFIYFWAFLIETTIVLFIGIYFYGKYFESVLLYIMFTIFSFYFIFLVLLQVWHANETVQQTSYLQKIDFLTQLPNNREIEKYLQQLIRKKSAFNVLLIDILEFKEFNVQYGFSAGDSIIQQLAQHLEEYANKNAAFAGRLGGEEFLLVLKDIPPAMAIIEANNLIKTIAQQPFDAPADTTVNIAVSIGISSYPDNGADLKQVMGNLVKAKQYAKSNPITSYFHSSNIKQ